MDGLIVDGFAGGGGASTGIEWATGRQVDIAINHDPEAIAMHEANHPYAKHLISNIWRVDPKEATGGKPVALAWFSPDCKHHSKAKGGKPLKKNIRDLAWVVTMWAEQTRPNIIFLENVEEFKDWGPLLEDDRPCPKSRGLTFKRFVRSLRNEGYKVEWRELRACDYGAPTIRKRLYMIARRDGLPIVWPKPTHAKKGTAGMLPFRTAADIIDWSLPCHSIFLTREEGRAVGVNRPLAENTMARIAKGILRYVLTGDPFIVNLTHHGGDRVEGMEDPLKTVTGANRGEKALITPYFAGVGGRASQSPPKTADAPLNTITAKADSAIVTPFLTKYYGTGAVGQPVDDPVHTVRSKDGMGVVSAFLAQHNGAESPRAGHSVEDPLSTVTGTGRQQAVVEAHLVAPHIMTMRNSGKPFNGADEPTHTITAGGAHLHQVSAFLAQHNTDVVGHPLTKPVSTIVGKGSHQNVVAAFIQNLKGSDQRMSPVDEPAPTQTAQGWHIAEVRAFLQRYCGGAEPIVMVNGEPWEIVDIGMRMLSPRELFRAQGFPDTYKIDPEFEGKPLTKTKQISCCGNSVCPPMAAAIVAANFGVIEEERNVA